MNTGNAFETTDEPGSEVLRRILSDASHSLTPRDIKALSLRFGLVDGRIHTVEEVSAECQMSCAHIELIQARTLHGYHTPESRRKLWEFLDD